MVLRITRRGQDQKIWLAQDHLTRLIATDLDPMLLPRLLPHLLLHQSCLREKMMIILPSSWIMPKECTSLPMSAEENIPTRFMMPASSTSRHFYHYLISFYLQQNTFDMWWAPIKSIKSSGHGMDIMMSSFGVLLGYTKPQEMFHTSTRQRNTTTISA